MCICGVELPPHNSQGALQTDHTQAAVLASAWKDVQELETQQESYRKPRLSNRMAPAWMLSQKHCFSVMETGSSQHGSSFGYRGTDTWGQHDGQPLSAEALSLDHPCAGTGGRGALGSVPLVSAWPKPKERACAGK